MTLIRTMETWFDPPTPVPRRLRCSKMGVSKRMQLVAEGNTVWPALVQASVVMHA